MAGISINVSISGCRWCNRRLGPVKGPPGKRRNPNTRACSQAKQTVVNPLTPWSDQHLISPYNINPKSLFKVMRIKEMITN